MKYGIEVAYWLAVVAMLVGMVTFWVASVKLKKPQIIKLAVMLTALCLGLGAFITYMYIDYLGYMTMIFSALTCLYGILIFKMGYSFLRPKKISRENYISVEREKDKTKLFYVDYSVTGDINGSVLKINLQVDKSNQKIVNLEMTENDGTLSYDKITKKKINPACCLAIEDIIEKNNMLEWCSLQTSKIIAEDGAVTSLDIWYLTGEKYHLSSLQELPEGAEARFTQIKNCMLEYLGRKNEGKSVSELE